MKLNRREFLLLTAGLAAGCQTEPEENHPVVRETQPVNAGPAGNYLRDGVYGAFRNQGFFLVRQGGQLFALSAYCTHRHCKLNARPDHSFSCPCHGSTFDAGGHVTEGPARRDLPVLAVTTNAAGELVVSVPL